MENKEPPKVPDDWEEECVVETTSPKQEQEEEEDEFLNDVFKLRFHDPNDEDWTMKSYVSLTDIGSVKDFWMAHKAIKDKYKQGIFFLMRESVFPSWDAPENINGGCLSIKVLKENVVDYMEQLSIALLSETLLKDEYKHDWAMINGVSASPKRYFCILKVWVSCMVYNDAKFFNIPPNFYGDIIWRPNLETIQNSHETPQPKGQYEHKHKS